VQTSPWTQQRTTTAGCSRTGKACQPSEHTGPGCRRTEGCDGCQGMPTSSQPEVLRQLLQQMMTQFADHPPVVLCCAPVQIQAGAQQPVSRIQPCARRIRGRPGSNRELLFPHHH
jgi:hypothetical protein